MNSPAFLSLGFRPFFFGAAHWALIAMVFWLLMLTGYPILQSAFDPVDWHAHEFLFGYLVAVIAGFLLTAVPNWTGRPPINGWPLGGLFALWLMGRGAVAFSLLLPPSVVALVDLAMPNVLAAVIAREIIASKNWRNLIVVGMLLVLIVGNAVFHLEAALGNFAAKGYGLRIGLGAGIMMIAVIGGRVVPAFTRNWLVQQDTTARPTPPMQRFDKGALLALLLALIGWVLMPEALGVAALLGLAGGLHLVRLARWKGLHTTAEPLVAVLHIAYVFVPFGALALAAQIAFPGVVSFGAVQHLWMSGAIGLMTLTIMTRATLGHSGQSLTAGTGTVLIYSCIVIATLLRVVASVWPLYASELYWGAGTMWMAAFLGFAVLYGPLLLRATPSKKA